MFNLNCTPAYPKLTVTAQLKATAEDFVVIEELGFEPSGTGEHVFIYIEKRGLNTSQVVGDIAKLLGIARKQIGYSGLKDKHALTRQWLSFPWPIKQDLPELSEPKLENRQGQTWQVLKLSRHDRKLKRGVHKKNYFQLRLTEIAGDKLEIEQRLALLQKQAVPNYFGLQRFGIQASNLERALQFFNGEAKLKPAQRSMLFSAARSFLFNQYLSQRIEQGHWQQAISGDVFMLAGSHSVFREAISEAILLRLSQQDIHCCGVLHGKGEALDDQAQRLWQAILTEHAILAQGLIKANCQQQYRALRVIAEQLEWQWQDEQTLDLQFYLPTGSYATSVLHELVTIKEAIW